MASDHFFVKQGPFPLKELIKAIGCVDDFSKINDFNIYGVESLSNAKENDLTSLLRKISAIVPDCSELGQ